MAEEIDLVGLSKEIEQVTKSIEMMNREVGDLPNKFNKLQTKQAQKSFDLINESILRISKQINAVDFGKGDARITNLIELLNKLKTTFDGFDGRIFGKLDFSSLSKKINEVANAEVLQRLDKFRSANNEAYKNMAKNIDAVLKKEKELIQLERSLRVQDVSRLKPAQQAAEYYGWQLSIMQRIVAANEAIKKTNDVPSLLRIKEYAVGLTEQLDAVQKRLNAIYEKSPEVQKYIQHAFGGKESVMDKDGNITTKFTEIAERTNKIKSNFEAVSDVVGSVDKKIADIAEKERDAVAASRQMTEEEIKRYSIEQKIKDQKSAEAKIQQEIERLVGEGNTKGIRAYLQQGASADKLRNVLSGIQSEMGKVNLKTEEGKKRLRELKAMYQVINDELRGTTSFAEKLNSVFSKSKNLVSQVAMSFGIMGGVFGATNFVKQLYKITSEFQLQQRALGAIVNNAREANILFRQMQSLAVSSPLKFMDLNKYAKQLAAYRIETNKLYDSLKMLGDISVGVGVDMDRLILAYGQVKAANYLRGQELRQFSEAGVNILGGLRDYYAETKNIQMSINEIFDSVSKRKVLFEDVDAVLKRMTQSGGTFYNMQLIQSQTLYGQIRKLSDMFQIEMNRIGDSTSGILLGTVKTMQFVLKNLGEILRLSVVIGSSVGIYKFYTNFKAAQLAADSMGRELTGLNKIIDIFSKRGIKGFKQMSKYIASSVKNINFMKLAVAAAAGAVAFGISKIVQHFQEEKEAARETAEELTELNSRLVAIRKVENKFKSVDSYDKRLAALQELVEKAKEFNYFMSIPLNVNEGNIDEVFNKLNENLKNYVNDVQYYTSAFSSKRIDKQIEKFGEMFPDFVMYSNQSKQALDFIENNLGRLDSYQKSIYDDIRQMQIDFIRDEDAAVHKYGITTEMLDREVAKRTKILLQSLTSNQFFFDKLRELFNDDRFFSNYFKFFNDYDKQIDKIEKKIKSKATGIDWNMFAGLEGDALKQKIENVIPAILEQFKDQAEFFKPEAAAAFARLFNVDEGLLVPVIFDFQKGDTDLNDPEWQKRYREIIKESGLEYDEKENAFVLETKVKTKVQNLSGQYQDVIRDNKQVLTELNLSAETSKEDFKKILDQSIDAFKQKADEYRQVKNDIINFDLKNKLEGINFATPDIAIEYFETLAKKYTEIREKGYGKKEDKTKHGRAQSMKSEYQSMIDFVRELNREFDTLRKNFNEKDSARWAGATNRILSSFEAKFGAMPTKFRKAFQDTLSSIDFTTKEGTVEAENIVKGLIDSAKDLTKKEKEELQRAWGEAVGQIKLEAELELKAREDERLKAQVQKMFDDYNLTIELDKLGVDADEVGKLFNIDTKDLLTLEKKLESMKEEFVGRNMEKEYRQFMRKIVEINDKANLEMAKKYVKYLREEYNERAKIELEYMRQRAEVYALPFDEDETMRILDNLKKETQKKLDEIDWKTFTSSDMYIEVFEDLERVSNSAIDSILKHLEELKDSLKDLSPTEMKTLVGQIEKLRDEMIRRDPFKALADSLKSLREESKKGSDTTKLINNILGNDTDAPIKNFRKTLNEALNIAREKQYEAQNKVNIASTMLGAGKAREEAKEWLEENWYIGVEDFDAKGLEEALKNIENARNNFAKQISNDRLQKILSGEERLGLTPEEEEYLKYDEQAKYVAKLISAYKELDNQGLRFASIEELSEYLDQANKDLKEVAEQSSNLADTKAKLDKWAKAIQAAGELLADWTQKAKESFDAVYEGLESLGIGTDTIGQAWKEFGDEMFDTISRALTAIPAMTTAIVGAETAIQAASGWIGLIAEAITLIMAGIKAVAGLHDSYKQAEIEKLQKSLDKLTKTAEDLDEAFDSLFNEDKLRQFDASLIKTRELEIATLEAMKEAERAKKKSDQSLIDDYQEQIDNLNKEMQEGIDKFYESLGGFGSEDNMKSMAESWTDAWYEAFKETGDGLSGLEDSFEEFFENIVKKTLMNNIMAKYFGEDFLARLDTILGTEGGVMGNLDALNDWITQYHDLAVQADEEMQAATQAIQNVTGIGGSLEGLQAGLQGMTEETADILAAYLNSVRFYVADNNQLLQNLLNGLTIDNNSNPMLQQLKIVAAQTTSINLLLDSVVHSGGYQGNGGGSYLKVHAILES